MVKDIVGLRAILQKEAVPHAAKTHAVAHDEIIRRVDRDETVAAVPDACADDAAAAHRVTAIMEMDRVAAKDLFFAEVAELCIGNRPARRRVVHRVSSCLGGIGGFDDDVAREVSGLTRIYRPALMAARWRVVESCDHRAAVFLAGFVDGDRRALRTLVRIASVGVQVPGEGPARAGEQDPVALFPIVYALGEIGIELVRIFVGPAQLDPSFCQRRAVQVHPATAADDSRTQKRVESLDKGQSNRRHVSGGGLLVGRANFQRGRRRARRCDRRRGMTVEPVLVRALPRLHLEQTHAQFGVPVAGERERPTYVNGAEHVVGDDVTGSDEHLFAGERETTVLPGRGVGPSTAACRADDGSLFRPNP